MLLHPPGTPHTPYRCGRVGRERFQEGASSGMKLELESADIEAIAKRVAELVKPALTRKRNFKD